jgi:hypothetical protein
VSLPTSKRIEISQLRTSLERLLGSYAAEIVIKDSFGTLKNMRVSMKEDMEIFKKTLDLLFGAAGETVYNVVIKQIE